MTAETPVPSRYKPPLVERAVLEAAIELHPEGLTVDELALTIVVDAGDHREVETALQAIRSLRQVGLLRYRSDNEVIKPTPAAFRAYSLLTR